MQKLVIQEHHLLTENILKSLFQNRITTLLDFLQEDPDKLSILCKLSLPQILEIRKSVLNKYSAPLVNGTSLYINELICKQFLSTGIVSLNAALQNGIPVGCITEICGLAGSGKSQLCMQLTINCVQTGNNTVLYIDTKGDFSAMRVQSILETHGFNYKDMANIMLKIKIVYIWCMEDLNKLLQQLKCEVLNIESLSLIIVDSLPSLMLQHFGDDNKMGLKFLNNFVNYARNISKKFEIGFICVNIQTRWINQEVIESEELEQQTTSTTYTEQWNRCLGKYWKNIPALVLFLEKCKESNENSSLVKITMASHYNNFHMNNDCTLQISSSGVSYQTYYYGKFKSIKQIHSRKGIAHIYNFYFKVHSEIRQPKIEITDDLIVVYDLFIYIYF